VKTLRWSVLAVLALALATWAAAPSSAFASSFPACDPSSEIPPTLQISDTTEDTSQLTATHPIQVVWSDRNSEQTLILDNYSVSAPFAMVPYDNVANFVPANPGSYTFALAWDQQQLLGASNQCSGSLSQAITVAPATRPRFSPVHFSFGGRRDDRVTELAWTLNTSGPRLNLGLVTAELRAVARDHLPSSQTPAHTLRFPLCDCDPLVGKVHNPTAVRVGPVRLAPDNTETGIRFLIDVNVSTTHVTRFGYDLLVLQGDYRLGRLRAAGTCHFAAGFSNCSVDHFPKPEK
jgi:hypothetical protein